MKEKYLKVIRVGLYENNKKCGYRTIMHILFYMFNVSYSGYGLRFNFIYKFNYKGDMKCLKRKDINVFYVKVN